MHGLFAVASLRPDEKDKNCTWVSFEPTALGPGSWVLVKRKSVAVKMLSTVTGPKAAQRGRHSR